MSIIISNKEYAYAKLYKKSEQYVNSSIAISDEEAVNLGINDYGYWYVGLNAPSQPYLTFISNNLITNNSEESGWRKIEKEYTTYLFHTDIYYTYRPLYKPNEGIYLGVNNYTDFYVVLPNGFIIIDNNDKDLINDDNSPFELYDQININRIDYNVYKSNGILFNYKIVYDGPRKPARSMYPDNIQIENLTLEQGEEKTISLSLNNTERNYGAFSFELELPEGLIIPQKDNYILNISTNKQRSNLYSLGSVKLENNTYKIFGISTSKVPIIGTEGEFIYITIKAKDNANIGTYQAIIKNISFSTDSDNNFGYDDINFQININESSILKPEPTGEINDPEPTGEPTNQSEPQDHYENMLPDNLQINNLILGKNNEAQLTINLINNERNYTAFQFDIELPEGVSITKNNYDSLNISINEQRAYDHTLASDYIGNNTYRIIAWSADTVPISGKEGELIYVTLKSNNIINTGEYLAKIKNILFVVNNYNNPYTYYLDDINFQIIINDSYTPEPTGEPTGQTSEPEPTGEPTGQTSEPEPTGESTGDIPTHKITKKENMYPDSLQIEDLIIERGTEVTIPINLQNIRYYCGFQFDIELPNGLSIPYKNENHTDVKANINKQRASSHTLGSGYSEDIDCYKLIAYSLTNTNINGTEGPLVYITIKADDNINIGEYQCTIKNTIFVLTSDETGEYISDGVIYTYNIGYQYVLDEINFKVTVI